MRRSNVVGSSGFRFGQFGGLGLSGFVRFSDLEVTGFRA